MTSFAHSKVSRAILMTVAMILASFAGCLGGETVPVEDIVEAIDDTIDNGTTNATDGGTTNTTDGGDVTVGIIVLFDSQVLLKHFRRKSQTATNAIWRGTKMEC